MNDISVKIVESPKGSSGEVSDVAAGSDVDPLAIEDDLKTSEEKQQEPVPEKAGSNENAKDEVKVVEAHQNGRSEGHTEAVEEDPIANALAKLEEDPKETEEPAQFAEEENSPTTLTFEEPMSIDINVTKISINQLEPQPSEPSKPLVSLIQHLEETSEPVAEINEPSEPSTEKPELKAENSEPVKPQLGTNTTITEPLSESLAEPSEPPTLSCEPLKALEALKPTQSLKEPSPNLESEVKLPSLEPENEPPEIESVVIRESSPIQVEKKEPSPEIVVSKVEEKPSLADVEMLEVKENSKDMEMPGKVEKKGTKETKITLPPVNGDISKEEQSTKRRASADIEADSPLKRLCQEVERTFPQHDSMINDFIQTTTKNNLEEIQRHTEQLLAEIQTLRELAQKKEHEWNNILHLKKVKEEILLRLLRRKQVLSFEKAPDINGSERTDPYDFLNQAKNLAIDKSDEISGLSIKQPGSSISPMIQQPIMPVTSPYNPMSLPPPYDKAHMHQTMPKPVFQPMMMPGLPGFPRHDMNGQLPTSFGMPMGRQGPTKDVKSIIADYRQRNPDVTPRRGRRMKSILNPNILNQPRPIAPKMDAMNNLNNLNMLFNNLDMNQKAMLERLQQMQAGGIPNSLFKDALVQYATMQQASAGMMPTRPPETLTTRPDHHPKERRRPEKVPVHEEKPPERPASSPRLPPPPYPEISLLPVTQSQDTQSSLLHGILTKAPPTSQGYSPTLAKLLTSPERRQSAPALPTYGQAKNCGEITITPVQPTPPPAEPQPEKPEEVVQLDDEESPASEGEAASPAGSGSGRLVIDEGTPEGTPEGADTPLCQGCRRRDAQFVCAGCANQWYCSRDCQVAAWDEHSEMCSG